MRDFQPERLAQPLKVDGYAVLNEVNAAYRGVFLELDMAYEVTRIRRIGNTHNQPNPLLNHESASNYQETREGYKQIRPVELASTLQSLLEMLPPQALSHLPRNIIKPENGISLSATSDEESRITQASDHDDSQIESVGNFSEFQSVHLKPEPVGCVTMPASDGYIWKKYGQKQVKASELPRSYYKYAQVNCPVTKKVGHSLDGNISEIIYKGQHNHDPTTLCNRANDGAANLKKRKFGKLEVGYVDQTSMPRVMITEPKVVVQMRSEVDILDDGFKWRKYGQKLVKGNTYPRSYYRCTYAGCKVQKQ
nr:hypothetical protein [Tanacetum cinerariifolium]